MWLTLCCYFRGCDWRPDIGSERHESSGFSWTSRAANSDTEGGVCRGTATWAQLRPRCTACCRTPWHNPALTSEIYSGPERNWADYKIREWSALPDDHLLRWFEIEGWVKKEKFNGEWVACPWVYEPYISSTRSWEGGSQEGEQPQLTKHTFCYTLEHTQVYLKHLKKE